MKVWHLKKDVSARVRIHPWIYNSEIASSVKEILPGELVELRDHKDHFVAFGYGNAKSQISFRKLSVNQKEKDVVGGVDFFVDRLEKASQLRRQAGWVNGSHRWLFAENDGLPGLIIDYFLTTEAPVIVVQSSTAGVDLLLPNVYQAIRKIMKDQPFRLVEASTSSSRKLEGLEAKAREVLEGRREGLEDTSILLRKSDRDTFLVKADFLRGQKTGFFLDQQFNAGLLRGLLQHKISRSIRVLDICCYVGQWSAHVADLGKELGVQVEAHLVDASERALSLAVENVEALGGVAHSYCVDVMESLPEGEFDVVVCDPPAFVKKRTDLERGGMAYQKLIKESIKRCKVGGTIVASSCSGLVDQDLWQSILVSSVTKAGRTVRWLAEGGHAPDHPLRSEFREGRYLKCSIGTVDFP